MKIVIWLGISLLIVTSVSEFLHFLISKGKNASQKFWVIKTKKWLTRGALGLSLSAFLYAVSFSLYVVQFCPAILRTSGSGKGWYLLGGAGSGILFFLVVWIIYGVARWGIISPVCSIAKYFRTANNDQDVNKPKADQDQ